MSEWIDHAREARKTLEWLARAGENTIREEGPLEVAVAQVHATLAVAEQLRLANLLQSGAIGGGPMNNHAPGDVQQYLRREWPDIAAALGIGRSDAAAQEGEGDD